MISGKQVVCHGTFGVFTSERKLEPVIAASNTLRLTCILRATYYPRSTTASRRRESQDAIGLTDIILLCPQISTCIHNCTQTWVPLLHKLSRSRTHQFCC